MATPKARIGTLPASERQAIFDAAKKLGLDPYEFGGFLSLESGVNMDPNIVGGAGGRHKGLIQFGQNEQQKYGIQGPQTRAGQIPKVLQYFEDRGYKPGMGIERAYATVLGGNPNVSLNSKDSFGTSVNSASKRFKKGGDLYANAQRVLGDPFNLTTTTATTATTTTTTAPNPQLPGVAATLAGALGQSVTQPEEEPRTLAQNLVDQFKGNIIQQMFPQGILGTLTVPNILGGR
jgi:hypothetical protein